MHASYVENFDIVDLLNNEIEKRSKRKAEASGSKNWVDDYGRNPLMYAVIKGDSKVVNELLLDESFRGSINDQDIDGRTALMMAAEKGNTAIVFVLLKAGATESINKKDSVGRTALMLGCRRGHLETILALLGAGASVKEIDTEGDTAFSLIAEKGNIAMMSLLLEKGAFIEGGNHWRGPILHAACERGDIEAVALLIQNAVSVNEINTMRESTALMNASAGGHTVIVEALLAAGAGKTIHYEGPNRRQTALNCAKSGGHADIVTLLETEIQKQEKGKNQSAEAPSDDNQEQRVEVSFPSASGPILYQYAAARENSPLHQLLSNIQLIKQLALKTEGDVKGEIEAEMAKIEGLQKEHHFTFETRLPNGKTIEAEIVGTLSSHAMANRLMQVFSKQSTLKRV